MKKEKMSNRQDFLKHFDRFQPNSSNDRLKTVLPKSRQRYYGCSFETLSIGDLIKVGFFVQENEKKRVQFFEGIIIAIKGHHFGKKVTLRKLGIERVFCCQSPQIQTLTILKNQKFHRSKLYYLRQRTKKRVFGRKDI